MPPKPVYRYDASNTCEQLGSNSSDVHSSGDQCCPSGFVLPDIDKSPVFLIVWALLLCWVFMGVALGADAFMTSIETITAQTRVTTVIVKGEKKRFHTRVWNDTVANLTLMALGSSAPEILLSVIETALLSSKGNFYAGDLGPATIVGSAAFNLMIITGVCIVALPAGETRTLKHLPVFLVTASFSLFAYIWMVIVLVVWTPNLITITEGLLTLSFMLILVAIAFAADQGYLSATGSAYASRSLKLLSIKREPTTRAHDAPDAPDGTPGVGVPVGSVPVITEAEVAKYLKTLELGLNTSSSTLGGGDIDIEMSGGKSPAASPSKESPGTRAQIEPTATSGTSTNPQASNLSPEEIAKGLMVEQDAARPTSRTEHRAKALKALTGGMSFKPSLRKLRSGSKESAADIIADSDITLTDVERTTFVGFVDATLTVTEGDDEHAVLTVARHGCLEGELTVRYATREGTAKAGSDYTHTEGTLTFAQGVKAQQIKVPIIDDDEIEDDEHMFVCLSDQEVRLAEGVAPVTARLAGPKLHTECTVVIKDDDALPGTFGWKEHAVRVVESERSVTLTIERRRGHNGEVSLQFDTKAKEALEDIDYKGQHETITFAHGEMSKTIVVEIIDDTAYEKDETFLCVLSEPSSGALFRDDTDGRAEQDICTVTIESDGGVRTKVDRVMQLLHMDRQRTELCCTQWHDQLCGAVMLEAEQRTPRGVVMHILVLPWKALFGIMPPPEAAGGWALFGCALGGILIQVVLIGDLASQLGCQLGMRDTVTAITIVALGTSLPDLFASMQAARDDPTADNSVGNVTGSNSVNVFLGLGLPWVMASVYWKIKGPTAEWRSNYPDLSRKYPDGGYVVCAGSLAFSVTVFTIVAIIALSVILLRRFLLNPSQELGGSKPLGYASAFCFLILYTIYLILSILRAEESVDAFNNFLSEVTCSPDCGIPCST